MRSSHRASAIGLAVITLVFAVGGFAKAAAPPFVAVIELPVAFAAWWPRHGRRLLAVLAGQGA